MLGLVSKSADHCIEKVRLSLDKLYPQIARVISPLALDSFLCELLEKTSELEVANEIATSLIRKSSKLSTKSLQESAHHTSALAGFRPSTFSSPSASSSYLFFSKRVRDFDAFLRYSEEA